MVTIGPKRFPIEMYRPNHRSPKAMAAFNFLQGSRLPIEFLVRFHAVKYPRGNSLIGKAYEIFSEQKDSYRFLMDFS